MNENIRIKKQRIFHNYLLIGNHDEHPFLVGIDPIEIMNNNSNEGDALSFRFSAYHAWAHNNDLFYSNRSTDKKQDKVGHRPAKLYKLI